MLNSFFGSVLKRSLSAHSMQVTLLLFTFYLNGGLHAVSIGKTYEQTTNFKKPNPNQILVFRTLLMTRYSGECSWSTDVKYSKLSKRGFV